jgi:hypothetical protein
MPSISKSFSNLFTIRGAKYDLETVRFIKVGSLSQCASTTAMCT